MEASRGLLYAEACWLSRADPVHAGRGKLGSVRVRDGNGDDVDAEFSVEQDGELLALILESASGPAGSRAARNTDYRKGLAILLGRLRTLGTVIQDALVDSAFTRRHGIPEAERRLLPAPVRLVDEPNIEALRLRLTSAQSRIGQAPGASKGGNSSKRIRIRVRVAGFSPEDAALLADELARPDLPSVLLSPRPAEPRSEADASEQAREIEQAVAQAAGKTARPGRGQGFQVDQVVKVAVESCAMRAATEFYGENWDVEDVHGNQSYDLICRRGGKVKHVEVKGTTADGTEVILTPNEVRHAREHPDAALFILSNIIVERSQDGTVTATGGEKHVYDPWPIDNGTLVPLGYRYLVPPDRPS
jgi:hypothetical protein